MKITDTSTGNMTRLAYLLSYPKDEAPMRATCEEAAEVLRELARLRATAGFAALEARAINGGHGG